jgi:hypothetical protein
MNIESIQERFDGARVLASINHSIGPTVLASLDDIPLLAAEVMRLKKALKAAKGLAGYIRVKHRDIWEGSVLEEELQQVENA